MLWRRSAALVMLGAVSIAPALAQLPTGGVERKVIVVPTGVEELGEVRINTGRKAQLSDGSYNTVYDKKTPGEGMTFLHFTVDMAVEGQRLALTAPDMRLESGGGAPRAYAPVDWFQDLGLEELRQDTLLVSERALLQITVEVPKENLDALTLFVASLRIGTVAEIRERMREQSGLK